MLMLAPEFPFQHVRLANILARSFSFPSPPFLSPYPWEQRKLVAKLPGMTFYGPVVPKAKQL